MEDRREKIDKQKFLNELIKEKSNWKILEQRSTGKYEINYVEDKYKENAYFKTELEIINDGIRGAVNKQILKFKEMVDEDLIKSFCCEIIFKAVDNFEIPNDTREGEEENRLYAYIIACLNTEIFNYVKEYTESKRSRKKGKNKLLTPKQLETIDKIIEDENGNQRLFIEDIAENQNYTFINSEYVKSDTYKIILDALKNELTQEEKEIFYILALANDNKSEAGKVIKEIDIKNCNKVRPTDEAYRAYIKRVRQKIINKIQSCINLNKIDKLIELKQTKREIEELINNDITEKDVIDFATKKLNEDQEYMNSVIYDDLNTEQRRNFIINFMQGKNNEKLEHEQLKTICRYILCGLYNQLDVLDKRIRAGSIAKIKKNTSPKNKRKDNFINTRTYYYIRHDMYNNDYIKLCKERKIKPKIMEEKIIYGRRYYLIYINKDEERMDWAKKKTEYYSKDLAGNIFLNSQTSAMPLYNNRVTNNFF